MQRRNVVIFGESGAGKSSVVNMLLGKNMAPTSSGLSGCTFSSTNYDVQIGGLQYSIYDTAGLNEAKYGTVSSKTAVKDLYRLISNLDSGVNLLIFCMRAKRITTNTVNNYKLFSGALSQGNVPVVAIITGLEGHEPTMDAWWFENKASFDRYNMHFMGHACITATKGKQIRGRYAFEAEYAMSKKVVENLITSKCRPDGWKMERIKWLKEFLKSVYSLLSQSAAPVWHPQELEGSLTESGIPTRTAREIVNHVHSNQSQSPTGGYWHKFLQIFRVAKNFGGRDSKEKSEGRQTVRSNGKGANGGSRKFPTKI